MIDLDAIMRAIDPDLLALVEWAAGGPAEQGLQGQEHAARIAVFAVDWSSLAHCRSAYRGRASMVASDPRWPAGAARYRVLQSASAGR